MLVFPQLPSGAEAQYPIKKHCVQRTIVNTLTDGHVVTLADPGAKISQWQLTYHNLADAELVTLQQFFAACEGQLTAFTFLDPLSNLLTWSETLNQAPWEASSLIQMTAGIADPLGGTAATRIANPTATDLTLRQTVNAPGWFTYSLSLYVSASGSAGVSLFLQAGAASISNSYAWRTTWARIQLSSALNTTAESLTAGIVIPAGSSVTVFGFQLEPQPVPSTYKRSFSAGGVNSNAHFGNDAFVCTTSGPNRHSCNLTVTAH